MKYNIVNANVNVLYVRFVFGIKGVKTPTLHIELLDFDLSELPVNFVIIFLIPVTTKNQNIYTNAFETDAENTDKINTPNMIIIGA
jgi:hypothetical protein